VTLTTSSLETAATLWESRALPAALALEVGVIDQEWPPADSVPETAAPGFVETLMVTMLYEWGRLSSTRAVQDRALVEALAGGIDQVEKPPADTRSAPRTLPILAATRRRACLIVMTVLATIVQQSSTTMLDV